MTERVYYSEHAPATDPNMRYVSFPVGCKIVIIITPGVLTDHIEFTVNGKPESLRNNRDSWQELHHMTLIGRTLFVQTGDGPETPWLNSLPYQHRKGWLKGL
jgi:hypothetical protein